MLKPLNNFIFYCYYSIVLYNREDKRIDRACFGLAMFYAIIAMTIFLQLGIWRIHFSINPIMLALSFPMIFAFTYLNGKHYFLSNFEIIETKYEKLIPKRGYVFFGLLFFIGSILLFGIAADRYTSMDK